MNIKCSYNPRSYIVNKGPHEAYLSITRFNSLPGKLAREHLTGVFEEKAITNLLFLRASRRLVVAEKRPFYSCGLKHLTCGCSEAWSDLWHKIERQTRTENKVLTFLTCFGGTTFVLLNVFTLREIFALKFGRKLWLRRANKKLRVDVRSLLSKVTGCLASIHRPSNEALECETGQFLPYFALWWSAIARKSVKKLACSDELRRLVVGWKTRVSSLFWTEPTLPTRLHLSISSTTNNCDEAGWIVKTYRLERCHSGRPYFFKGLGVL